MNASRKLKAQPGQLPLDREGELLALELWATIGMDQRVRNGLAKFRAGSPEELGRATVSATRGLRVRAGPSAAIRLLRGTVSEGLDLTDPKQADALQALVRYSIEGGQPEEVAADVDAALAAHPDFAAFQAIRGLWLERTGAGGDEVRAAYRRALDLDPNERLALQGLGRLALEFEHVKIDLELIKGRTGYNCKDTPGCIQGDLGGGREKMAFDCPAGGFSPLQKPNGENQFEAFLGFL